MGQQLELINHRNKIMLQLFAVIWVVIALLNAATDPMLLIDFLVMGLVLFGTLGFLVRKRKFIKGTMYLITLIIYSMSAVSILGTPVMGNLIIVLFWQVFFSLYQNTTLTITNGVVTISLFSYAFWGMSGAISGYTVVEYSMLMITSVFTTLVLIVISRTTSRLLRNTEQSRIEAEHAKHRAEEVLQETQAAISALTAFSNKLNQTVAHTHVSSSEVASAMTEMAGAVETQSRSVGGINERMRQVGRFVHDVASSSDSMREASTQTMSVIEHSSSEVAHLNTQMTLAQEHAAKTARLVNELNQKSEQISAIILVISNIARQTNMLALNASIEAARAGEHGRGFTVVAEEIRKLADHSHQSVGEVIAILDEIKSKSSEATTQVDLSETTFSHINEITGNVTSGYANIIANTKDVVRKATDSGELIRHLQSNLDTITTDIHLVAALSDENTSSIESILSAIEEQSRTIQQIVENFRDLQEQSQGLQHLMDQH